MAEKDFYNILKNAPQVMGIINVTPDSFSKDGLYLDVPRALDRIYIMLKDGASIIDIGGESTRPGSEGVSTQEELKRVIPVLEAAVKSFPDAAFSVDTTKYEVAKAALEAGAGLINDVSGLQKEPALAGLAADFDCPIVIMHSKGDPKTMQDDPHYEDVVEEVRVFFREKIKAAKERGTKKIILDPGFGFGKNLVHNLKLAAQLHVFKDFGYPVLVGASRKSMIGKILNNSPVNERLFGTVALHYHCLMKGADIIRVHDVKAASDSVRIFTAVQSQS